MSDSEGVFEGGENIGVSEEFRNAIINVKKSLNDKIVVLAWNYFDYIKKNNEFIADQIISIKDLER